MLLLWLLSQRLLPDGADGAPPAAGGSGAAAAAAAAAEGGDALARRLFLSSRLSAKLLQQLSDALAVSSGALPQWARLLLDRCPALFSARARSMYFRSSAFGVSRAVHWSQECQVSSVRSAYAEELAALERARLEAELGNDPQVSTRQHTLPNANTPFRTPTHPLPNAPCCRPF